MKFVELSKYLEKLEKTASRNEMTEILSELFKKTSSAEIEKTVNLLLGQLAPSYEAVVFNIAERMMIQILAKAYDVEVKKARAIYKEKGDLGIAAESLSKTKGKGLSVEKVYLRLLDVAQEEGKGSQERKVTKMADLLSDLDSLSSRYVARIPVGKLRLGFSDMTILDALSFMLKGDKSARKELERAFNVTANIGKIAERVKKKGLKDIKQVKAEPGTPIRPSLAERLPSAEKILEKVGDKVAIEPKYDGFRTQVHLYRDDGQEKVKIFSRNLDNTTHMFPDLVEAVKKLKVESAIFDGEAIAYNEKEDKFLPFQETVQRKRKHGIKEAVAKYPLVLFIFDILYKDGKTLLNEKFTKRRKILERIVKDHKNGTVRVTEQNIVSDPDKIRQMISNYLSEGLEGGMIKKIDAAYEAGGRGYHWVKYKKTTQKDLADTIDCVVMGTYKGRGKRAKFGLGAFLVGVREKNEFKSISKIGTGLTDAQFKELDKRTKKLFVDKKPKEYDVDKNLEPDDWTSPSLVVEIMADEITKSPVHTAGKKEKRGFALRFPRLVRFRDDKDPENATSVKEVEELYKLQKK
jgi:DNA ligase-1